MVAEEDHRPRTPPSDLIPAVVSSSGRCAVTDALRLSNKTLNHGLLPFLFDKTTQYDEVKKVKSSGHKAFYKLHRALDKFGII